MALAVAAVMLLVEAVGIAVVNWVLGIVVERQEMSLAGSDPAVMSVGTWILGGAMALYLIGVAVILVRAAATGRVPGRTGRILTVVTAVVHGVLGAVAAALVGWLVFTWTMVLLGLLIFAVMLFGDDGTEEGGPAPGDVPPGRPSLV
ncbi:hypothetical protein GCM10027168_35240 [Streptomyces capparidis]